MTHEEMLELIFNKCINKHYAKRYINFIKYCSNVQNTGYTENHHILPKAKTLFPEYSNLRINKWNSIKLTGRQHFIAHWLIWKAFGGFMAYAFKAMQRKSKYQKDRYFKINSRIYEKLKIEAAETQSTRKISKQTSINMSNAQKNSEKFTCPHCGVIGNKSNMYRWHFDNCKTLTGKLKHDVKQNHSIVECPHCGLTGKLQGMHANHFDNCPKIKPKKQKEYITCPHCLVDIPNSKNFINLHFDNCPTLTGIKREQSPKQKAANVNRSLSQLGKPKPRKIKSQQLDL